MNPAFHAPTAAVWMEYIERDTRIGRATRNMADELYIRCTRAPTGPALHLRPAHLAEHLGIESRTMTRHITELVNAGYIRRDKGEHPLWIYHLTLPDPLPVFADEDEAADAYV